MFICYLDALSHMTNSVSALGTEDTRPCVQILVTVLEMNARVSQGYIERDSVSNQTAQQQNLDRYHTYVMRFIRIYCQIYHTRHKHEILQSKKLKTSYIFW